MNSLAHRYDALKQAQPRLRIRDAADALGVSELELVLLDPRTVRLRDEVPALLARLPEVGEIMALTRNPWAVHERHGAWRRPRVHGGKVGLVVGPDIDLRLFLDHWAHVVATVVDNARGPLHALQAFDASGAAVHKIYRREATDEAAWDALIADFADPSPAPLDLAPPAEPAAVQPDEDVDADALRDAWAAMKDTHDAHGLLREHGVARTQAMRLLGEPWARPVDPREAVAAVLEGAADDGQSIMVFVGNPGCIQIHTGPVERVAWRGEWLNVLDPRFNLHLDTRGIDGAWAVRKPTEDGPVHSLELYAADGSTVVQLFGERKPGRPQDPTWQARIEALPTLG